MVPSLSGSVLLLASVRSDLWYRWMVTAADRMGSSNSDDFRYPGDRHESIGFIQKEGGLI